MKKMQIYHADSDKVANSRAESMAGTATLTPRSPFDGVTKDARGTVTAADVMKKSGLDWRVEEHKLFTEDKTPVPSHKAIIRSDNNLLLGVVGDNYVPLQNAEAFSFADSLVATGRMEFLSAGQFSDGKRIFIQCKLNNKDGGNGGNSGKGGLGLTEIAPGDSVQPYFMLANGHDGSLAVRAMLTSIRVICQNTFAAAIARDGKKRETSASIKHTKNIAERLEASRTLFTWATETFEEFVETGRMLVKKPMGKEAVLKNYFRAVFETGDNDDVFSAQLKNREERLLELFQVGHGNAEKSVRGSYWAAANAVTEYLTHESRTSIKGVDTEKLGPDERSLLQRAKRLESGLIGGNHRITERALQLAVMA